MRPERLRISAFGPYAGQEDLDFSALGESYALSHLRPYRRREIHHP